MNTANGTQCKVSVGDVRFAIHRILGGVGSNYVVVPCGGHGCDLVHEIVPMTHPDPRVLVAKHCQCGFKTELTADDIVAMIYECASWRKTKTKDEAFEVHRQSAAVYGVDLFEVVANAVIPLSGHDYTMAHIRRGDAINYVSKPTQLFWWLNGYSAHSMSTFMPPDDAHPDALFQLSYDSDNQRCCPDFSCCVPELLADRSTRAAFTRNERLRDQLSIGFLHAAVARANPGAKVNIITEDDLLDSLLSGKPIEPTTH